MKLWDLRNLSEPVLVMVGHERYVAAGCERTVAWLTIRLLFMCTIQSPTLLPTRSAIKNCEVTRSGTVVSAAYDGTIRLWDLNSPVTHRSYFCWRALYIFTLPCHLSCCPSITSHCVKGSYHPPDGHHFL